MVILHDTITGVSDVFGLGHDDHFFREQNLYIHCFDDSMIVRELTHALQPGREVISYTVRFLGWEGKRLLIVLISGCLIIVLLCANL